MDVDIGEMTLFLFLFELKKDENSGSVPVTAVTLGVPYPKKMFDLNQSFCSF